MGRSAGHLPARYSIRVSRHASTGRAGCAPVEAILIKNVKARKIASMNETAWILSENDLLFVIRTLMPGYREQGRMIKILQEDADILEGMLADEKLFRILVDDPQSLVRVSPQLFFTVLLNQVKSELKERSYTVETGFGSPALVFDSGKVVRFLEDRRMRNYLADMLASFVRINSFTIPVRIRKGIWRKYRFSDFDIDSLIRYSEILAEEQRFPSYKRIADICLFTRGVFPDFLEGRTVGVPRDKQSASRLAGKDKEELEKYGTHFYRAAAEYAELMERYRSSPLEQERLQGTVQVLQYLSEHFVLAVKPLSIMASRYLEPFKEELFLQ
jgi:hypothetical protein